MPSAWATSTWPRPKRTRSSIDQAINYYIEAGLLYQKEKNSGRQAALLKNAQYWLFEKYDYNAKIKKYNATVKPVKPAGQQRQGNQGAGVRV